MCQSSSVLRTRNWLTLNWKIILEGPPAPSKSLVKKVTWKLYFPAIHWSVFWVQVWQLMSILNQVSYLISFFLASYLDKKDWSTLWSCDGFDDLLLMAMSFFRISTWWPIWKMYNSCRLLSRFKTGWNPFWKGSCQKAIQHWLSPHCLDKELRNDSGKNCIQSLIGSCAFFFFLHSFSLFWWWAIIRRLH